jgi:tetratricopeptide (TPR) repeat protein
MSDHSAGTRQAPPNRVRFDSWKEIASYLHTSVRTTQRWEKTEGLPVRRHEHARQDTVYGYQDEIDSWRIGRDRKALIGEAAWEVELKTVRDALAKVRPPRLAPVSGRISRHTVGRTAEWEQLRESLHTVSQGHTQLACLVGEPGIGKTTLLEDVVEELNTCGEDWRVMWATCSERLSGTEAYLPVMEMLEVLMAASSDMSVARLLKLVAPTWYVQVAPLWSTSDPSFAAVAERARVASPQRMKRELAAFVGELTIIMPLMMVIDDMQWADASTVELISYLCRKPGLNRLLIICAYRPTEMSLAGHPFIPVKQELMKQRICREISMRLLSQRDIESYLALRFLQNQFPPAFAPALYRRTGGNPFFLVELIQDLLEQGSLVEQDSRWALTIRPDQLNRSFPDSVQSMIEKKIDQLDDRDRRLVAAASVQGVEFDSLVAARAAGFDLAEAEERLRRLERVNHLVRLLSDSNPKDALLSERYTFVHILYQSSFYLSMTPARRVDLSAAVAAALTQLNKANLPKVAAELALLYEAARDFGCAAQCFLDAAKNATRVYANHEAVELSRRAMAAADRLPDEQRLPLILKVAFQLAELHLTLSRFDDAVSDFGIAEKAATEADLIEPRIEAICGAALALFNLKRTDETRALGQHALDLACRSGSETGVASADMVLAMERMAVGDLDAADELTLRAVPILQTRPASPVALHAIEGVAYGAALHGWRLEYEQALPLCQWSLERARERGVGFHIVCLLFIRGLGMGNFGRISEALDNLGEGMRLSEVNHECYWLPRLPNTLGWLHADIFDFEEAFRLNQEGAAIARELKFPEGEANSYINLAANYLVLGEPERAKDHLLAAEGMLEGDAWFRWVYNIRLQAKFAEYWMARGDLQRAATYIAASLELARSTKRRKHIAWAQKLLGDVAAMEERHEQAVHDYEAGLSALKDHPCPSVEWRILLSLSNSKESLHKSDEAHRCRALAQELMRRLAESISEGRLRTTFLRSKPARDLRVRM